MVSPVCSAMFQAGSILQTIPVWRQGMQAGQNKNLTGTAPSTSAPNPPVDGEERYRIDAWNGSAFNRTTSEIMQAACGGHTGTSSNGVFGIRLSVDAPGTNGGSNGEAGWGTRKPSTTTASGNIIACSNTGYYGDSTPASRHTYVYNWYFPSLNRIMMLSLESRWCSGSGSKNLVDGFNLATNSWDAPGTWAPCPYLTPGASLGAAGNCFIDSVNEVFYCIPDTTSQLSNYIISWDAKAAAAGNTSPWSRWQPFVPTSQNFGGFTLGFINSTDNPAAFDTARSRVVFKDGGSTAAALLPISGPSGPTSFTKITGGIVPVSPGPFGYDEGLDKFVIIPMGALGTISLFDPVTFARTTMAMTGDVPPNINVAQGAGGGYNRFGYAPALKGFYWVSQFGQPVSFIATQFIG